MKIKALVEDFVKERNAAPGDTVQFGWFVSRVVTAGESPEVESLDFRRVASFTKDFSEVERIHALQSETLNRFAALECLCTLQQYAVVSRSYCPERKDVFLKRQRAAEGRDSGWYVGVFDEKRDMDDPGSFTRVSLYELTIGDMRFAAYWLLPVGTVIAVEGE